MKNRLKEQGIGKFNLKYILESGRRAQEGILLAFLKETGINGRITLAFTYFFSHPMWEPSTA